MKCYYVENETSHERWFFSSKDKANRFLRDKYKEEPTSEFFVDEVHWAMNKAGIITMLNAWAVNGEELA